MNDPTSSNYPTTPQQRRRRWLVPVAVAGVAAVAGAGLAAITVPSSDSTQPQQLETVVVGDAPVDPGSPQVQPGTSRSLLAVSDSARQAAEGSRDRIGSMAIGTSLPAAEWAELVLPIEMARGPIRLSVVETQPGLEGAGGDSDVQVYADGSWSVRRGRGTTVGDGDGTLTSIGVMPGQATIQVGGNRDLGDPTGRHLTTDEFANRMLYPSFWLSVNATNIDVNVVFEALDIEADIATWRVLFGEGAAKYDPAGWTLSTSLRTGAITHQVMRLADGSSRVAEVEELPIEPDATASAPTIPAGTKIVIIEAGSNDPGGLLQVDTDLTIDEALARRGEARPFTDEDLYAGTGR